MTVAEAQAELGRMVDSTVAPTLTSDDLADLLTKSKLADAGGLAPDSLSGWVTVTVYALNAQIVPSTRNGHYYKATTGGTSGATEPTWPTTSGGTVTDGTVVWTEQGSAWDPTFDLNRGTAAGWERKASRVATEFTFTTDGQSFNRSEKFKLLMATAESFRRKIVSDVVMPGATADATE